MTNTQEPLLESKVIFLGVLEDFGLGSEDGIPTKLVDATSEQLTGYGETLQQNLANITDAFHLACIDGRCKQCNADGSAPEVRANQVGGTGILIGVAMNAEADFLGEFEQRGLKENIETCEEFYEATTGIKPSAHLGGCGGVNGEVEDEDAVANDPRIIRATEALMSQPDVLQFTDLPFEDKIGLKVVENAKKTKQYLIENGWNGQEYVDNVKAKNPAGVEDLETRDDPHHGHAEDAIAIVIGKNLSINMPGVFIVSLDASTNMALAFAGQRGVEGAQQVLTANIAKHLATSCRLASPKTPIFLVVANQ